MKYGELRLSPAYNFVGFDIETGRGKDKQLDNFKITGDAWYFFRQKISITWLLPVAIPLKCR